MAGSASDKEFSRVAVDVNIAYALAYSDRAKHGELAEDLFARAGYALNEAQRMHREHGRYGVATGINSIAICEAIDLWEEILRASSPRQLQEAERLVLEAGRAGRTMGKEKAQAT